jgi:hypothetical protein
LIQKIRAITAGTAVSAWDNATNSVSIANNSATAVQLGNTTSTALISIGSTGGTPLIQLLNNSGGGVALNGGAHNFTATAGSNALNMTMHATQNRIQLGNTTNDTCFFATRPGYHLRSYPTTFSTTVELSGATVNYTSDQVLRGLVIRTHTADMTDQLPLGATVIATLTTATLNAVGQSFELIIKNTSSDFTLTVNGNTNFQFSAVDNITNAINTQVRIGPANTKTYKCVMTSGTAITAYEISRKNFHSVVAKAGAINAAGALTNATVRFFGPYISSNNSSNTVVLNASNNATIDTHTMGFGGVFRAITVTASSNLSATSGTPDATFSFGITNTAQNALTQFVTSPASVAFPLATLTTPRFVRVLATPNSANICTFSSFIGGRITTPTYNALANYPDFEISLKFELD